MSIHINQVLDYLDTHPVCQFADDVESLMGMLHRVYFMHNSIDSEALQGILHSLHSVLEPLPVEDTEQLSELISSLCMEKEQLAFSQGIVVGMQLMTEVNTLP